jgi:hypothetical protein
MRKKKLDIAQLLDNLEHLEEELKAAGSPKTAIRRVRDVKVSINWLEKNARVG